MSLPTSPELPNVSATESARHGTLGAAARRGFVLGIRFGAIIWCVILFVIALIYCGAQAYGWLALGRLPDPPLQTSIEWLQAAGGILVSLILVAGYSAIAGMAVVVSVAFLRLLRSRAETRTR
jgi:uncharacterized integral membrane protein